MRITMDQSIQEMSGMGPDGYDFTVVPVNTTILGSDGHLTVDVKQALVIPAITFALGVFGNGLAIVFLLMYKYRRVRPRSPVTCSSGMAPSPRLPRSGRNSYCDPANHPDRRRSSAMLRARHEIGNFKRARRRRNKFGPFHTLVLGLITVDLIGNLVTAPLTLLLYSTNRTIEAVGGDALCRYSAFAMMYLGIVTMASLMTMAIERVLSIQFPYYYHRHITPRRATYAIFIILIGSAIFTSLPALNFGKVRSMFPHTWCFADWNATKPKDKAFNFIYAISGILMIFTTVLCNITVVVGLFKMKRRLKSRKKNTVRKETQMIIQLIVMTCIYLVCWLPLMTRILANQLNNEKLYDQDRVAIWLAAVNPVLDPWVYILLRRSVLKKLVKVTKSLCFSEVPGEFFGGNAQNGDAGNDLKPENGTFILKENGAIPALIITPETPVARKKLTSRNDIITTSLDSIYDNINENTNLKDSCQS